MKLTIAIIALAAPFLKTATAATIPEVEEIVERDYYDCDPFLTVFKSVTFTVYSTDMQQSIHSRVGTTAYTELQLAPCASQGLPTSTVTITVPSATVTVTTTA
ncbi:hypothetical protein CANINC_000088 [Pichia inconspicua]|uniref:Uncharacterized protein n=1 Tax=Pichia inconspicua TaxID=52247 RepID=A0A4T0X8U1_9ASCO|nr:hypothetical protein CANINC_000088 [[Candida] inconspicua]